MLICELSRERIFHWIGITSDWRRKMKESVQLERDEEELTNRRTGRQLNRLTEEPQYQWYKINLLLTGIQERKDSEDRTEKLLEDLRVKNFSGWYKMPPFRPRGSVNPKQDKYKKSHT